MASIEKPYYVIQSKNFDYETQWTTWKDRSFSTLEEAEAFFATLPIKSNHRIAQAYTVTRYKAVKCT